MDFNLEEMNKEYDEDLKKQGYVEHLLLERSGKWKYKKSFKTIHAREGTQLVFRHTTGFFRKKCYLDIIDANRDYRMTLSVPWDNALFYDDCPSFRQLCEGNQESIQKILDLVVSDKPVDRFFVDALNKNRKFSCSNCMIYKFSRICITKNW